MSRFLRRLSPPARSDRPKFWRVGSLLALPALLVLGPARPASAHGIGGDAVGKSVPDFVPIGIEHMLLGWDHLLFIVAVVILAGAPRRAAKFVSLFAAGHSLTLVVATLAEWRVDPDVVDVVIALSIAYVGVIGVRGSPYNWKAFGAGVFGFGLVHGLGLSTRFQDLGLPEDGRLPRVIAFNVGIEIGQLMAIAGVVLFGLLLLDFANKRDLVRDARFLRGANAVVLVLGLIAAGVMTAKARTKDPYHELVAGSNGCAVRTEEAPLVYEGGHPPRAFFQPGEKYLEADFGHVVGDGLVVIRYRDDLTAAEQGELRTYVAANQADGMVAGAVGGQVPALLVTTQSRVLSCAGLDMAILEGFAQLWFKEREAW